MSVLRVTEFIHVDADVTQGKMRVRYIWRFEGVGREQVIEFSTASRG